MESSVSLARQPSVSAAYTHHHPLVSPLRFDPHRAALDPRHRTALGPWSQSLPRRASPPVEYAVFVCDLVPDVREEDLVAAFLNPPGPRPFTSTRSAKVMLDTTTGRSMGFGFVRFLDEADCQRALVEMQGVTITSRSGNGRPVRLNPANPRKGGEGSTPSDASPGDHAMLRDYFDNRGRYSNPTPAEIAMQSSLVPSQSSWASLPGFPTIPASGASGPVDVSLRNNGAPSGSSFGGPASLANTGFMLGPSTLPSPSSALDPNNTTVFVGGLSSLISEDTLKTFFAPFGAIAYVKIPPGKGCGFVSFLRKIDAERAIERMQGFPVGGCRIRLSWGRSQGEKSQHLAQQQMNNLNQLAGLAGLGGLKSLKPQQLAHLADLTQALQQQQQGGGGGAIGRERGRTRSSSGRFYEDQPYQHNEANSELTQEILHRFLQSSAGSSGNGAGSGGGGWPASFSDPYGTGQGAEHRMAASARPFESRHYSGEGEHGGDWHGDDAADLPNVFGTLGLDDDAAAYKYSQQHTRGFTEGAGSHEPYRGEATTRPHALTISDHTRRAWQQPSTASPAMPPSWSAPDIALPPPGSSRGIARDSSYASFQSGGSGSGIGHVGGGWLSSSPLDGGASRQIAGPAYKSYRDADEDDRHKGFSPFSPVIGGNEELPRVGRVAGVETSSEVARSGAVGGEPKETTKAASPSSSRSSPASSAKVTSPAQAASPTSFKA